MERELPGVFGDLSDIEWVEGKRIEFAPSSYRHRQVVVCTPNRPFKARFANGEFSYIAYWELVRGDGSWNKQGVNVVPVLPGEPERFLMVIEQRGPMGQYEAELPRVLELSDGKTLDLRVFGRFSSLEFPGGGVEEGETAIIAGLKELAQETGIPEQPGTLFLNPHPVFPYVCDLAHVNYIGTVYLSSGEFASKVQNDGGLHIVALTENEIERNIRNGVFCSMNAGLGMWYWHQSLVRQAHECQRIWGGAPPPVSPMHLLIKRVQVRIPS
ncbi:MAG: hypothetical protein A3E37_04880 [Candidatus Andersenbacteria bacterium RIFCSPHIGHO2_12_FULL_46_9]|nr:MAG: hypothetical protein UW94_C0012G0046 [Parcubacteria group bacterium GW2011_GWA2_45_14]OGY34452.1 MAG: hypothetical protein A3B76_04055 [Candidatus Andersenbacteria bacterium RIFCSPHIGHO2_02_FULL_46_16]OGY36300.1 MAG: hypothetical protein A3E37_04880 [Candidatus Andersenbacteria bacterium RIFCSPHIGHO2_12_FULL_46_9]OGY38188.1 MAG: hypothetical protein A3I08_00925 [Candidatus Andersenbacteria bacterium RIFCSPLOWO2_02_FULL_46_11]HBE90120.1 hypothetical protein [Candidatus Andersenbacteria b